MFLKYRLLLLLFVVLLSTETFAQAGSKKIAWIPISCVENPSLGYMSSEGVLQGRGVSVTPYFFLDDKPVSLQDAQIEYMLDNDYLPFPIMKVRFKDCSMTIAAFVTTAVGEAELVATYTISNQGTGQLKGKLYLVVSSARNQKTNEPDWTIETLGYDGEIFYVNTSYPLLALIRPNAGGLFISGAADPFTLQSKDHFPAKRMIHDDGKRCSGVVDYSFDLTPGMQQDFGFLISLQSGASDIPPNSPPDIMTQIIGNKSDGVRQGWLQKTSLVLYDLPKEEKKLINMYKTCKTRTADPEEQQALPPVKKGKSSKKKKGAAPSVAAVSGSESRKVMDLLANGKRTEAYNLLEKIVDNAYPSGWNLLPDMQDVRAFTDAFEAMFVKVDEAHQSIVLASGVQEKWIDDIMGANMGNYPTPYGPIGFIMRAQPDYVEVQVYGNISDKCKSIVVKSPRSKPIKSVTVDDEKISSFTATEFTLTTLSSRVKIYY